MRRFGQAPKQKPALASRAPLTACLELTAARIRGSGCGAMLRVLVCSIARARVSRAQDGRPAAPVAAARLRSAYHGDITAMIVRSATAADAPDLARLVGELGYPAEPLEIVARLRNLKANGRVVVMVAEAQGRVVGLATGHCIDTLHSVGAVAWLTTLVVDSDSRSQGIGRRLTESIEDWAQLEGASRISVASGLHRRDAHAFYERVGYVRSGVRLTKPLGQPRIMDQLAAQGTHAPE